MTRRKVEIYGRHCCASVVCRSVVGAIVVCGILISHLSDAAATERAVEIGACLKYQLGVSEIGADEVIQKVSEVNWRMAQSLCRKVLAIGNEDWRIGYTYAQVLAAKSLSGLPHGDFSGYDRRGLMDAMTYLSPSLMGENAEPYLFKAYLSKFIRSESWIAYTQYQSKLTRSEVDPYLIKQVESDRINGSTTERWFFVAACLGSIKAFEELSRFYIENALNDRMSGSQKIHFDRDSSLSTLLNDVREKKNGNSAEVLGAQYYKTSLARPSLAKFLKIEAADWRVAATIHWAVLSQISNAYGWTSYAFNGADDGGRLKQRSEVFQNMEREEFLKYSFNVCGPFLRRHSIFDLQKLDAGHVDLQ